jgi:hypothetical protein
MMGKHRIVLMRLLALSSVMFSCVKRDFNAGSESMAGGTSPSKASVPKVLPASLSSLPLLQLLQENSSDSRARVAASFEKEFEDVLASSDAANAAMKVAVAFTIRGLRNGADKLCTDEEKISLFRGVSAPLVTKSGEPLLPADGLTGATKSFRRLSDGATQGRSADFGVHAKKVIAASVESPFAWATLSPKLAAQGADKVLKLRVCPQRALALVDDAVVQTRYAVFAAVLPEEIENVMAPVEVEGTIPSGLLLCFQRVEQGRKSEFVKAAVRETAELRSSRILEGALKQLEGTQAADWLLMDLEAQENCSCAGVVKRANTAAFRVTKNSTPQFKESDFCPDAN